MRPTERLSELLNNAVLLLFLLSLIPVAYAACAVGSICDWIDYH